MIRNCIICGIEFIPLSSFNFFNEDGTENIEEIRKAWSLDNLQPLWAKDNLSKGNKIV